MKLILNIVGFVLIMSALLLLPHIGDGVAGVKGYAISIIGWVLWWRLVEWLYRTKPRSAQPSGSSDPSDTRSTGAPRVQH